MGQHLEQEMTFTYPTMHHPIEILTQTLVGPTARLVDTVMGAHLHKHS